jgi:gamma-carbonic anhydrase
MIEEYDGKRPRFGEDVFIASTAAIIGDVEIARGSSVWYGAVIRGDRSLIRIGRNTNIQDNCTIHSDPTYPVSIGDNVSIGHNAAIHGCTVEDNCIIGIGAIILSGVTVKRNSIVAPGSVVLMDQIVGPQHLAAGVPAALKRGLSPEDTAHIIENADIYAELARKYLVKGRG